MSEIFDLVIIGSGPAGMTAAIYAKRAGLQAIVIDKAGNGGQVLSTYEVDNYPGMPGISGFELSQKFKEHADHLGVEFAFDEVAGMNAEGEVKTVFGEEKEYHCKTILIASGARHAKLNVPGENELSGAGVSYCATCDGAFFKNRTVAVVGGGDVAVEDAIFLARACQKVYLIHRRDSLRAAQSLQDVLFQKDNIEVIWNHTIQKICGENQVSSIILTEKETEKERELHLDGVFVAVGIIPNSNEFTGKIAVNGNGYIVADESCQTSIPGVFAAGDVRQKPLRQIVTAVADGANAVTSVENYLISTK